MNIRKMVKEDCGEVSRLYALSWKSAYKGLLPQTYLDELREDSRLSACQSWIDNDSYTSLVLTKKRKIIGTAVFGISRSAEYPDWGEILSIYLLPEYFGQGYGALLMNRVLFDMRKLGFDHVYLWVLRDNKRAQAFYKKMGFTATEETLRFTLAGEDLTDYRYIYSFNPNISSRVDTL